MAKSVLEAFKKSQDIDALVKGMGGEKSNYNDDRLWNYFQDKTGKAYAVIRFLPAPEGEVSPIVKVFSHGFKSETGKWLIENCPTTIGEKCPVCEDNSRLWDSGKAGQDLVRGGDNNPGRKRKLSYYANILVLSHPAKPEDEGKVFIFRFGAKIYDKIIGAMRPEFPDVKPFDPFHLWNGANFALRVKKKDGQTNYDDSKFEEVSELYGGDEKKLVETVKGLHSLLEFTSPENYKSYAELQKKMKWVLGESYVGGMDESDIRSSSSPSIRSASVESHDDDDDMQMDDDDNPLERLRSIASE